jgi:polyphenol oxidase
VTPEALVQTSQVHGAAVRVVEGHELRADVLHDEADALVARDPRIAIGVRVADCVPILVHDAETGDVAAIHAGWKGLVAGVIQEAVRTLRDQRPTSATTSSLVAAVGPSIGGCCFEVGDDVAATIVRSVGGDESIVSTRDPRPRIDLRRATRLTLRSLGVADDAIEDVGGCTMCNPALYFSYRRDGARSGRHLAAIRPTNAARIR